MPPKRKAANPPTDKPAKKAKPDYTPAVNWAFTFNNYDQHRELVDALWKPDIMKYLVYGYEKGENNTPHLQGFVQFKRRFSQPRVQEYLPKCHVSKMYYHSSVERNQKYCSKQGEYKEFGVAVSQGERTDWEEIRDIAKVTPAYKLTAVILDLFPEKSVYMQAIEAMKIFCPKATPPDIQLKDWQLELNEFLQQPPPTNLIRFYVDPVGGAGKTTFFKWFLGQHPQDVLCLSGGKHNNMYYCYDGQPYVFFDLTRTRDSEDAHMPYPVFENIKNGFRPNSMFGKLPAQYDPPHLVVFCNQMPDTKALTSNRFYIVQLSTTNAY